MKALDMNPTLWSAYEKLGKLGENIMPNKIFNDIKMKSYELNPKRNINITPLSRKRKEVPSQQSRRRNSVQFSESTSNSCLK